MIKKMFYCIIMLLIGIGSVNAATGTISQSSGCNPAGVKPVINIDKGFVNNNKDSYQIGELITVQLSISETRDFYVLVASPTNAANVIAISKEIIGQSTWFRVDQNGDCHIEQANDYNISYIKTVVDDLTKNWSNVQTGNVGLISMNQIETLIGQTIPSKSDAAVNFSFPANLPINSAEPYWTSTYAEFQASADPSNCDVYIIKGTAATPNANIPKDNVENPQTGITSTYVYGGIALVGLISAIIIFKKRNYFEKV